MDKIFNILGSLVITAIVVVGGLTILTAGEFTTEQNGDTETHTGLYELLGTVPTDSFSDDDIHITPSEVNNIASAIPPIVTYNSHIIKTWKAVSYESLFNVKIGNTTFAGTDGENGGFYIRIEDVTGSDGYSVLKTADHDIAAETDNITFPMLYNTSDETLTFYDAGVYKIYIRVVDKNGKVTNTTVAIPVETDF